MKRSSPPRRKKPLARSQPPRRSRKPIAKQGNYGRKRQARYAAYLKSPRWKELKLIALTKANFCCERCRTGIEDVRLEVHHKRYPKVLGQETSADLEVLCTYCHRAHHSKDMKRRIA
jgi:5-methylcytosine-specific restriction endonuclease McrA